MLIESRGESAVITGDMMHNPIQIAVPGDEGRFDMDKAAAAQTRREFVERFNDTPHARDRQPLLPSPRPDTSCPMAQPGS